MPAGANSVSRSSANDLSQRRYLRPREFCSIYGRSRSWLAKIIREGRIDTVKLGPSRMICAASAERLFREGF